MNTQTDDIESRLADAASRHRAGDTRAAEAEYDAILSADPDCAEALHLKGILLGQTGRGADGLQLLDRAVALAAADSRIRANRAKLRLDQGDVDGALEDYRTALAGTPEDAGLLFNAAGALAMAGRLDEAVEHLERACEAAPDHARAHTNLGNLYRQMGRMDDAGRVLERAIELAPGDAEVQHSLGVTLMQARDYEGAAARFRRALELDRGFVRTAAQLFYANLHACDWRDYDKLVANFGRLISQRGAPLGQLSPLISLFIPCEQRALNAVADARADIVRRATVERPAAPRQASDRIHVAYLSADLGRHPVGHLTADLFHRHDPEQIESSAVLLAPPDGSDVSAHVGEGVGQTVDVSRMSASAAAAKIREMGVDILVDLGGHTRSARPEILAARPAPLQIGWLGFCGSSGGLNDVILADEAVLPRAEARCFREAVAHLPGTFMPLNNFDRPAEDAGDRQAHALPADALVFCAFNTPTKIDPTTFTAWMDILKAVPGSVLWLREHAPATTRNLQVVAQQHGVDPGRLVFAKRAERMADHLARHTHADLFLDSFVYGAHSTAADAVAMGLPVLTLAGPAMPSRVGASLAAAYGLEEIAALSRDEYIATAVALAGDPARLSRLREHLATTRETHGGSAEFVRKLDAAYTQLWQAHRDGNLKPGETIHIDPPAHQET